MTKQPSIILIITIGIVSIFCLGIFIGSINFKASTPPHWIGLISAAVALFIFFSTQFITQKREDKKTITSKFEDMYSEIQSLKFYINELERVRKSLDCIDLDNQRRSRDSDKLEQLFEVLESKHSRVFTIINLHFFNDISKEQRKALQEHYDFASSRKTQRTLEYLNVMNNNPRSKETYIKNLEEISNVIQKKRFHNYH
ncbi:hypothetical protein [Vibrio cyclitrophicus]|uniref:hypothetical protein n=1 Tax=Vibrio cyclitrophicus TaxID=47951 RepID=UPI0002FD8AC3|nr:hypothetical protein [Vibrio cyclitrophicus]OEE15550.1 hypothetical protein OC1_12780 [Vibrio cyclitrophicus ZF207]